MSSSGLIYAVIVGAWAAYLVPMWLRRQDELNEARPTERFSTAIRLLSGRAAMERRYAKALEDSGEEPQDGEGPDDPHDDHAEEPPGVVDVRALALPMKRPKQPVADVPAPPQAPAPQSARQQPDDSRRARVLARRRRTTTALFLAFTAGAIVAAVGGLQLLWLPLLPGVLLTLYIVHLRRQERHRFEVRIDNHRAAEAAKLLRERRVGDRHAGDRPAGGERRGGDRPGHERPAGERRGHERPGPERPGPERPGSERRGPERHQGERPAPERRASERPGSERRASERPPAERRAAERPGAERQGPERHAAERPGAERPAGERHRAERRGAAPRPPAAGAPAQKPVTKPPAKPKPRSRAEQDRSRERAAAEDAAARRAVVEETDHADWADGVRGRGSDQEGWDPVPVPLPTYVTAPVAPRSTRQGEPAPLPESPADRPHPSPARRARERGSTPLFDQHDPDGRPKAANE